MINWGFVMVMLQAMHPLIKQSNSFRLIMFMDSHLGLYVLLLQEPLNRAQIGMRNVMRMHLDLNICALSLAVALK